MRQITSVFCGLFVALFVVTVQAQQPAFRGGVSLMTVDVTVLDKEGKPVPGLTAADFQVKLNGKVQPIRALSYLEARTDAPSTPAPKGPVMPQLFPVAEVKESAPESASEPRVFVILVDDLSFPPLGGKALFTAAQRFTAGLPPGDLVGFATSSGPGSVNPTRDRAPIAAALKAVVGEYFDPRSIDRGGGSGGKNPGPDQSIGLSQALDIERGDLTALKEAIARECFNGDRGIFNTQSVEAVIASSQCASDIRVQARRTAQLTKQTTDRQTAAFQSVIKAMKPAAGIKHLLLLTEGLGITFDSSSLEPVAQAAAEAGIQLSVMVEEPGMSLTDQGRREAGLQTAAQADTGMSRRRREDNAMFVNGAHTMADMVGGAFYRVVGDADPFFRRVVIASSAIYRLAVDPPSDAKPGKDFSLVATVRRSGLTTLTNKRAMVTTPAEAALTAPTASTASAPAAAAPRSAGSVDDQIRAAMNAGRAFSGVPVTLASALRRAADPAQIEIGISVQIPATAKGPLTAVFGVVDEAGQLRSGRRTIEAPAEGDSYRVAFSVAVTPGAYQLRFAVADASGLVGSVSRPVRAELAAMGPFTASDLQTTWIDQAEQEQGQFPGPQELPSTAKALNVALDLYAIAGAAPRDVLVKMEFGPAGQPSSIERVVVPVNDNGVFRVDAQFPLERVAPGTYSVQVGVLVDGMVIGTKTASIAIKLR
jgi:VWFA-related protein